ncbi:MAG: TerB family tellurite resistance protein [Kofleriaceae bacterium]
MHLDGTDFAALDDNQRLAVLETMIVGMVADDKVTPAEVRRFDEIVLGLPWGVEHDVLVSMIKGAKDRVLAVKTPAQINDFVLGLAARLPDPKLRDKVIFTMATLMFSDGDIAKVEQNVLGLFVVAFGITSDRVGAIREALRLPAATPPPPPTTAN